MEITEERLAEIVGSAITQALSERRKEVATHFCFCADPSMKEKHEQEHEAIRLVMRFLQRFEKAKWSFGLIVIGTIASAILILIWEGIKIKIKGG